jgi:hypothetical protein
MNKCLSIALLGILLAMTAGCSHQQAHERLKRMLEKASRN